MIARTLIALTVLLAAVTAEARPKRADILRIKLCQDTEACLEGRVPGCPETEQERKDLRDYLCASCADVMMGDLCLAPVSVPAREAPRVSRVRRR